MEELKYIDLNDNEIERNSTLIEKEMSALMETEEGEKIKDDIKLLNEMGYDRKR